MNPNWADSTPFDDAAPIFRLARNGRRGHRGVGNLCNVEPPSQDVPLFRGKCPDRRSRGRRANGCPCPRCRIDAELEAYQWAALAAERRHSARARR